MIGAGSDEQCDDLRVRIGPGGLDQWRHAFGTPILDRTGTEQCLQDFVLDLWRGPRGRTPAFIPGTKLREREVDCTSDHRSPDRTSAVASGSALMTSRSGPNVLLLKNSKSVRDWLRAFRT